MATTSKTKEGDYKAVTGEVIRSSTSEYEVLDFLGKGTFGQVGRKGTVFHDFVRWANSLQSPFYYLVTGSQVLEERFRRSRGHQGPQGHPIIRETRPDRSGGIGAVENGVREQSQFRSRLRDLLAPGTHLYRVRTLADEPLRLLEEYELPPHPPQTHSSHPSTSTSVSDEAERDGSRPCRP